MSWVAIGCFAAVLVAVFLMGRGVMTDFDVQFVGSGDRTAGPHLVRLGTYFLAGSGLVLSLFARRIVIGLFLMASGPVLLAFFLTYREAIYPFFAFLLLAPSWVLAALWACRTRDPS